VERGLRDLKEIIIPNDLAAARCPENAILEEAQACGYGDDAAFAVKLALEEALTNAFRHGNKRDPGKRITVCYSVTAEQIEIEVIDEGEGFEPDKVPDPTQPEYIDRPHGRGIMLMRAYLDKVEYSQTGNSVRLVILNKP
jgi:serine/threonine-protein kinase RsbW